MNAHESWGRYLVSPPDGTAGVPKAEDRSYNYVHVPELGLAHSTQLLKTWHWQSTWVLDLGPVLVPARRRLLT
jgi:hypothetical protein